VVYSGAMARGLVVLVVEDLGVSGRFCMCCHSKVGADKEPFVDVRYKGDCDCVG